MPTTVTARPSDHPKHVRNTMKIKPGTKMVFELNKDGGPVLRDGPRYKARSRPLRKSKTHLYVYDIGLVSNCRSKSMNSPAMSCTDLQREQTRW